MNWKIAYTNDQEYVREYKTIEDIEKSGMAILKAKVPGNFQNDLVHNKFEQDYYYSTNILNLRKYERTHVWYFAEFESFEHGYLEFEGIDTVSEIYINGIKTLDTDNMFRTYKVSENIKEGTNQVVVHIIPAVVAAEKYRDLPSYCFAYKYNWESLYIRKAPHMYGWDIVPRTVTSGLWKDVTVRRLRKCELSDCYIRTTKVNAFDETASVRFSANVSIREDAKKEFAQLTYVVKVKDDKHTFEQTGSLLGDKIDVTVDIQRAKLWWPKNYGKQFLYDASIIILEGTKEIAVFDTRLGLRTVELAFDLPSEKKPDGDFCFIVNGKRVFLNGTNWVPLDAMHITDSEQLEKAFEGITDLNCNIIRCWGGNVYESERFFDLCDENGVLVWQDFAMACAVYPRDKEFADRLELEAIEQVSRIRNHPSIALFAGDNECDLAIYDWNKPQAIPDDNTLTRVVLPKVVSKFASEIPYLPSSPYMKGRGKMDSNNLPENHLWGPRDYFKSEFYTTNRAVFASETGYFGMPAPSSIKKFIAKDKVWPYIKDDKVNEDYMLHSTAMETTQDCPYSYRMRLLMKQVDVLFGKHAEDFDTFCRESQISQAEAMKYFIERFRVKKGERNGIIWWNLVDGWPQISDAVMDYYMSKKLAYYFIKRSQNPLCIMFDEPDENGIHSLHAVNDLQYKDNVTYYVKDLDKNDNIIASGTFEIEGDSNIIIENLKLEKKHFYLICWTTSSGKAFTNHFVTDIGDLDFKTYENDLKKAGYNEFGENFR